MDIKRFKYLRHTKTEQYLLDILSNVTEYVEGGNRYFKYNGEIIFSIIIFDEIKIWDRNTINGRKNIKVKSHGWCKYASFWEKFKIYFGLDYVHTQDIFNKIIGTYYNLDYPIFEMESTDTMCLNWEIKKLK